MPVEFDDTIRAIGAKVKDKPRKIRLDQLLVERGLVESRTRAQALVMAGVVYSDTLKLQKPGDQVREDIPLAIKGEDHPWVSRGGIKLAHAIEHFSLNVTGFIAADIGSSTGGFTDVLLHYGAAKVYAVDVGRGQLHHRLRQDARVVVLEETNARHLTAEHLPEPLSIIVCDVSFISLKTVLPTVLGMAAPGVLLAALIKPQFEVGKNQVGKGGVVRDSALHEAVCSDIHEWLEARDWRVRGVTISPITGPAGNKEFVIVAQKAPPV